MFETNIRDRIDEKFVGEEQINVVYDSNLSNAKIKLYKWTDSYEKCYQRGHLAKNCYGPKRKKKLQSINNFSTLSLGFL